MVRGMSGPCRAWWHGGMVAMHGMAWHGAWHEQAMQGEPRPGRACANSMGSGHQHEAQGCTPPPTSSRPASTAARRRPAGDVGGVAGALEGVGLAADIGRHKRAAWRAGRWQPGAPGTATGGGSATILRSVWAPAHLHPEPKTGRQLS